MVQKGSLIPELGHSSHATAIPPEPQCCHLKKGLTARPVDPWQAFVDSQRARLSQGRHLEETTRAPLPAGPARPRRGRSILQTKGPRRKKTPSFNLLKEEKGAGEGSNKMLLLHL